MHKINFNLGLKMDKDQSKKNIPLKQAIKNAALKPFQRGKPKTQGKQSCKIIIIILTLMFHVDILGD